MLFLIAGGLFDERERPAATIGKDVAVPGAFFKVAVVLEPGQGPDDIGPATRVIAVVMPNETGILDQGWGQYRTTVDEIERRAGYDLADRPPRGRAADAGGARRRRARRRPLSCALRSRRPSSRGRATRPTDGGRRRRHRSRRARPVDPNVGEVALEQVHEPPVSPRLGQRRVAGVPRQVDHRREEVARRRDLDRRRRAEALGREQRGRRGRVAARPERAQLVIGLAGEQQALRGLRRDARSSSGEMDEACMWISGRLLGGGELAVA